MAFAETFVAARNPRGDNTDFGEEHQGEELEPGQTLNSSGSIAVDTTGSWRFSPCYILGTGGEGASCPDEWGALQFAVGE